MRTDLSGDFLAQLQERSTRPFWCAVFHFPAPKGDYYFATRPVTFNGQTCQVVLSGIGPIGSTGARGEPLRLDVSATDIAYNNMLVLTSGERVSSLFGPDLETALVDIYLGFLPAPVGVDPFQGLPQAAADVTPITSARMFPGIIHGQQTAPVSYGFRNGSVHIDSLAERYMRAPAVDVMTATDYPYADSNVIGQSLPIAFGQVDRSPGRIVRRKVLMASAPVPGAGNSGQGSLSSAIANPGAVSETWTATFLESAVVEQTTNDAEWGAGAKSNDIAFDAASTKTQDNGTHTVSWSHTFGGSRRVAVLHVTTYYGFASSASIGGVPMTLAATAEWRDGMLNVIVRSYILVNPASGAQTVTVGSSAPAEVFACELVSFSECDPVPNTVAYAYVTAARSVSAKLANPGQNSPFGIGDDDRMTDLFILPQAPGSGPTPGANQTNRATVQRPGNGSFMRASTSSSNTAGGGKGGMSWSWGGTSLKAGEINFLLTRRREARARPFTMPSTQTLTAIRVPCRVNPASVLTSPRLYVAIVTDAAGVPSTTLVTQGSAVVSQTTQAEVEVPVTNVSLTSGTTYWVVVGSDADIHGESGLLVARKFTGNVYLGYASYGMSTSWQQNYRWGFVVAGGDLTFRLKFTPAEFTVAGTVSGVQGTGNIGADFTSNDGHVTIKAAAWVGQPAGGDTFSWTISSGAPTAIFSLSPADTPVSAIGAVYVEDGGVVTVDPASIVTRDLSVIDEAGHSVARVTFNADLSDDAAVQADLIGLCDDANGTFSGVASVPVSNPADVIALFLAVRGVPVSLIDVAESFAHARQETVTRGYTFAGLVQDIGTVQEQVAKLAYEARSSFVWADDKAELHFQYSFKDGPPMIDTLSLADIVRAEDGEPQVAVERTGIHEVVNSVSFSWNRIARLGSYGGSTKRRDAQSVTWLGELTRPDLEKLDFLSTSAGVTDLAQFVLDTKAAPETRRVRIKARARAIPFEVDDVVGLDFTVTAEDSTFPIDQTLFGNLGDALDGLDGGQPFVIETKQIDPADLTVALVLREL